MDLTEKLEEYEKAFKDGFPMYQLGIGRSEDEISNIIDECIKAKKDVYELGYLKDDMDIIY